MKIFSLILRLFFIAFLLILPLFCYSQKGSIKIFSETKGIKVYLDDELKGTDVSVIDSVNPGVHYIKITKDTSLVYSELVKIKINEIHTILVKKIEDPQKENREYLALVKLYRTNRLEVLLDRKYALDKVNPYDVEFIDYFSYDGSVRIDTTSMKNTVDDWFILQGGANEISDLDFATQIKNQQLEDEITNNKIKRINRKVFGYTTFGIGVITMMVGVQFLLGPDIKSMSLEKQLKVGQMIFAGGFIPLAGGLTIAGLPSTRAYTIKEALVNVNNYNLELKRQLGLPDNF